MSSTANVPFKCIHVPSLPQQITNETLSTYFKQFGETELVRLVKYSDFNEAYVLYKHGVHATNALITCHHRIQNTPIKVYASDLHSKDFATSEETEPIKSTVEDAVVGAGVDESSFNGRINADEHSLLDLNDDCLTEVFSYLDTDEFCSLAITNSRLKRLADSLFFARHKQICVSLNTKKRIELVLKSFGPLLADFQITNTWHLYADYNSDLMRMLVSYCSGTLKRLYLGRFTFKGEAIEQAQPLFKSLEKLTLDDCDYVGTAFPQVFQHSSELRSLKVLGPGYGRINCDFIMCHFPKLESIQLSTLEHLQDIHMQVFIKKNPQLKKLKIHNCSNLTTNIYEIIGKNLKNLEDLRINEIVYSNFKKNIMHITKLRNLRKLQIHCSDQLVTTFLTSLESRETLTHLQLSYTDITPQLINTICQLPSLTLLKFHFVKSFREVYVKQLKRRLPKIREIHLSATEFIPYKLINRSIRITD